MDRQAALEEIQDVVRDVLGDDDIVLTEAMAAEEVDGWDSMAHVNIIIAIEKRFGIQLKATDLAQLRVEGAKLSALVDLVTTAG